MDIKPSQPNPQQEPQSVDDYVEVEFRAAALVKFNEVFTSREQPAVLALLVEHAHEGIEVAKEDDIPVRLLTLFHMRFRFLDLRDIGKLLILSLENSNNNSPPPRQGKWKDPLISGGVSALVRWLLGQILGRVGVVPRIAAVNGIAVHRANVFLVDRVSARTLGLRN